jgi:hypothetical protein
MESESLRSFRKRELRCKLNVFLAVLRAYGPEWLRAVLSNRRYGRSL